MFRREIFDFFPEPGTSKAAGPGRPGPASPTGRWTSSRALLEDDVPFYSHEIDAYWNDIGNLEELRAGNLDALSGAVKIEQVGEVVDGIRSGEPAGDGVELEGRCCSAPAARSATTSVSTAPR